MCEVSRPKVRYTSPVARGTTPPVASVSGASELATEGWAVWLLLREGRQGDYERKGLEIFIRTSGRGFNESFFR